MAFISYTNVITPFLPKTTISPSLNSFSLLCSHIHITEVDFTLLKSSVITAAYLEVVIALGETKIKSLHLNRWCLNVIFHTTSV